MDRHERSVTDAAASSPCFPAPCFVFCQGADDEEMQHVDTWHGRAALWQHFSEKKKIDIAQEILLHGYQRQKSTMYHALGRTRGAFLLDGPTPVQLVFAAAPNLDECLISP